MTITSFSFAGYVLLVLALYYALPRRPQNILLLVASYAFYLTWSWWYALVLAILTLANFALAGRIRAGGTPRRALLWAGVGINLAALAVFKYEDFFVPDLLARLDTWGVESGAGGLDILLPVGM